MKKLFTFYIIVLLGQITHSQNISYGLNLTNSIYQYIELKTPSVQGSLKGLTSNLNFNYGGFLEYNFNEKIGLRGSLLYGKKEDNYYQYQFITLHVTTLQFNPVVKYAFGKNYDKGLYSFAGPRLTYVLKTENNGTEITDFYKKTNFGFQLGLGVNFLEYFAFEFGGFQGVPNFLESIDEKNYYIDVSASIIIKIDNLITK